MKARALWIILIGLVWFAPAVTALADDVPSDRQAMILARALAYDTKLKDRVGETLTIAVLYRQGDSDSEDVRDDMVKAFEKTAKLKVQGLPMNVVTIAFSDGASLEASITRAEVDAIYLSSGLDGGLREIISVARKKDISTLSGQKKYIEAGVAIGVVLQKRKPSIMVNLPATQAEGMNLMSDLLKLAKVIR